MKANSFFTTLATLAACGSFTLNYAEKVQFERLPRPLQDAIRSHAGSSPVEDIDLQLQNGTAIYEVAFKKDGKNTEMRFGADGNMLDSTGKALLDSRKISFKEVPEAVQQIVRSRAGRAAIEDVDR